VNASIPHSKDRDDLGSLAAAKCITAKEILRQLFLRHFLSEREVQSASDISMRQYLTVLDSDLFVHLLGDERTKGRDFLNKTVYRSLSASCGVGLLASESALTFWKPKRNRFVKKRTGNKRFPPLKESSARLPTDKNASWPSGGCVNLPSG